MIYINSLSEKELLSFAVENGIIDLNTIQKQIEMNERKKYLEMHKFKKWKGADGNWHTYLPDKEKGRLQKKRKTEAEIDDLIIAYYKEQSYDPTISEVFAEWNDRRLELQKISHATHLRNAQCFDRHYGEFGKRKIKRMLPEDIGDFLEEQIPKHGLTAKAFSNLKCITKGFLKYAKKKRLIDFNVQELLGELDVSENEFKRVVREDCEEVFDEEEMPTVINYLISNLDVWNIGILLMFVTGIRVGELVALKHNVFSGNSFKIRRTESKYRGEDGRYIYLVKEFPKSAAGVREVVIPDDYVWITEKIRLLNPFGEYIFTNQKGERMTTNCIRRRLRRICEKLDIYQKSPHKIRKTYGSILLDNNVDSRLVTGQMGHTDILCTENHYHRNRRSTEKKSEILSKIPELKNAFDYF